MAKWGKTTVIVGSIIAIAGQFVPGYYLALVGGIVALVGVLGCN